MPKPAALSPKQIADALGRSRRHVYRWIHDGELPTTKIDGRHHITEKQLAEKVGNEMAATVFDTYASND